MFLCIRRKLIKSTIPSDTKLNEAIRELIMERVIEDCEDVTPEEVKKWEEDQEYWAKKKKK